MSKTLKRLNLIAAFAGLALLVLSFLPTGASACGMYNCDVCIYSQNCSSCHDGGTICTSWWGEVYSDWGDGGCVGLWCTQEFCTDECMVPEGGDH
jgi:hypothetical protein